MELGDFDQDDLQELFERCYKDPQWESEHLSLRPLRGLQAEIIVRIEKFVRAHEGGVMTIMAPRQIGKNDLAAVLQRRHLLFNQLCEHIYVHLDPNGINIQTSNREFNEAP